jgi:hypothetical protein
VVNSLQCRREAAHHANSPKRVAIARGRASRSAISGRPPDFTIPATDGAHVSLFFEELVDTCPGYLARATLALFAVNVLLQVFDGFATYAGCQVGFVEGNPLVAYAMECLGPATGLFLAKMTAAAFLGGLWLVRTHHLVPAALTLTASVYVAFSLVPWSAALLLPPPV